MGNTIPTRIAETLVSFPPFSLMKDADALAIAEQATVSIGVKGDTLWKQGGTPSSTLLFLARGRVEYHWEHENNAELVDVRDVGDLLGLTALYDYTPYAVTAKVAEDSLFYGFDWEFVRTLIDQSDAARNYVRRHLFWATRLGNTFSLPNKTQARVVSRSKNILQAHLDGAQVIKPRRASRLLTCSPSSSIQAATLQMIERKVNSIIVVNEQMHPLGIVTYRDLVKNIIVGGVDREAAIETIMSRPVVTVETQSSSTAALLLMLQKRIGAVCVTEDGSDRSTLLDVCTEKDLLAQSGHHPAGLLREIRSAKTTARLRELCDDIEKIVQSYLEASVSSVFVGQICAELYDELVSTLIHLKLSELESEGYVLPAIRWTWIAVGSDGRREQLLRTDIDNGILFEDSEDPVLMEEHRKKLITLARRVIDGMVECGFAKCQGGVMALNPKWCKSESEWKEEIRILKTNPQEDSILKTVVAIDMRRVSGDLDLFEAMRSYIFKELQNAPNALRFIAQSIIGNTLPLKFSKQFVVEKKGKRELEFDIKNRALAPLRSAAQLLSLKYSLMRRYSTGGRWEDIGNQVEALKDLAPLAEEAYEFLLKMRTLNGLKRGDSGRYIEASSITGLERSQLVNTIDVVRMVQSKVRMEFGIDPRL